MDAEILVATSSRNSTMTAGIFLISAYPTILKIRIKSSRLIPSISNRSSVFCSLCIHAKSAGLWGFEATLLILFEFSLALTEWIACTLLSARSFVGWVFFLTCIVQGDNPRENRWVVDLPNIKYFGVTNYRHGTTS